MKYYIIVGEASGDLHASNLIAEIRKKDAQAEIRAWGGDLMKKQGATLVKHYRHLAFMGFVEVLFNFKAIMRNLKQCKADLLNFRPDAVILVDYPGFNLRIADFAHKNKLKVFYYISPQIWAWKRRRVYKIRKTVDKMLVILPFEEEFYRRYGVNVTYVGNPLLDELSKLNVGGRKNFLRRNNLNENREIIALLPGSRRQEVGRMMGEMLKVVQDFPSYQFVVAGAPSLDKSFYTKLIGDANVGLVENQTYELLQNASAALVASGTATLETALLSVPEVVCYRANTISYKIAKHLVKVNHISLVNLVMDADVVKELIQDDFTRENISKELRALLGDVKKQRKLLDDYDALRSKLGNAGASEKAANIIVTSLKAKRP
jgi:lipid-A-disaccharide synthase